MAKNIEELEQIKLQIKDGKVNDAYQAALAQIERARGEMSAELLALIAGLVRVMSLGGNFKQADDLLTRALPLVTPKDDHYFLGLADELVQHSESNVISNWENSKALDKLIDQAVRIREELIGPDASTAEVIIDSVMTNLQRARQTANSGLAVEAAGRLTRCRTLMAQLDSIQAGISRPADLLLARVNTLRAFFNHSQGNKTEAKENYQQALRFFERVAARNNLERTDLFELFIQQGQHFNMTPSEKQHFERLKKVKGLPRSKGTMHKIRAFPSTEHIAEIMQKARATQGKTFHLTSLGFLGTQSLNVSVVCATTGDLTFSIEPSRTDGASSEIITLVSDDSQEVLRHIKDLWKRLQTRPTGMLTLSNKQADFKDGTPLHTAPAQAQAQAPAQTQASTPPFSPMVAPMAPKQTAPLLPLTTEQPPVQPTRMPDGTAFEGNLKTMPSLGLLQTIAASENNGALEVSQTDGQLTIYFDGGKPVHGELSNKAAEGVDVLHLFVMQQEGWFRFVPGKRAEKISIKVKAEQFILEAAAFFDENKYLKSLGLTMYSALLPKESLGDWQELARAFEERGAPYDDHVNHLYKAILQAPIAAEALDLSSLSLANWVHALYKLVQSGLIVISNDGLDDADISKMLVTSWTYDKKKVEQFNNTLYDTRTGLLRFEFLVFMLEREFERARTQMWPLSLIVFEIRKRNQEVSALSLADKELVQSVLAQISDTKRSIDWLCHFQDEQFAVLMPGLDKGLAAMFGRNFVEVCARNLGKLKEGQGDWEYSFGLASLPVDTIEWPRMVGFAIEAQRASRMGRLGLGQHGPEE